MSLGVATAQRTALRFPANAATLTQSASAACSESKCLI